MDPQIVIEPGQVEWRISRRPVDYRAAVAEMEERVAAIRAEAASELVWLLEHPPLYTAGTSARDEDLLDPGRLPVHRAGRGGRYTYHGPGQRIAYVVLDLRRRGRMCSAMSTSSRRGSSGRWRISACMASGATAASASGWREAADAKKKSRRSACACGNG